MTNKVVSIILASGTGERLGHHLPKQFIKIAGKTILEHTIDVFEKNAATDEIYIVVNPLYRTLMEEIILRNSYKKVKKILNGGATRRESSQIGINAVEHKNAKVLIHDAVRPFVSEKMIFDCVSALDRYDAVDTAIPASDTIIEVDDAMIIKSIPERKYIMRGQTPQAFRLETIKKAHELAEKEEKLSFTDDCGIVLYFGLTPVHVVRGEEKNIKITYIEDVFLADKLFQLKAVEYCGNSEKENLSGKVIVIFGASKGIGSAISEKAKEYGATIYGYSKSDGLDIKDFKEVERVLAEVKEKEGKIDFVVNTAGILRMGKVETRDMADIADEIAVNYIAAVNIVRASVPYLRETKGSILLFTSSSYTRGRALYSVYSSSKAAIVNFVQACSEELNEEGIRINTINPERTATPMRFENFGKEPVGSLLQPEKVADVSIKTLVSDLTGQVIYVTKES